MWHKIFGPITEQDKAELMQSQFTINTQYTWLKIVLTRDRIPFISKKYPPCSKEISTDLCIVMKEKKIQLIFLLLNLIAILSFSKDNLNKSVAEKEEIWVDPRETYIRGVPYFFGIDPVSV